MDPKEKKVKEEELNVEETQNHAEEQPQNEQVDDFERAIKTMETATDVNAVKEGVELIYNKFMAVLAQNGVKVIETKDQPLDTDYHEAIAVIPAPSEAQKGKILDCVQTGYTLNDKVLRHAKVVVGE